MFYLLDNNITISWGSSDDVNTGILYINYLGLKGAICDSSFTEEDASVICRSKGYYGGLGSCCGRMGRSSSDYPIWMNNAVCAGNESSIVDCSWDEMWGRTDCRVQGAAGIICYDEASANSM